jgi:hypothetical protein
LRKLDAQRVYPKPSLLEGSANISSSSPSLKAASAALMWWSFADIARALDLDGAALLKEITVSDQ